MSPLTPTPDGPPPMDPAPGNLAPENPTPENPTPENPTPENPTPENPTPKNPTPENAAPGNLAPMDAASVNPAPQNPAPVSLAPESLAPADPLTLPASLTWRSPTLPEVSHPLLPMSNLLFWLIEALRPRLSVIMPPSDPTDHGAFILTIHALQRVGHGGLVVLPRPEGALPRLAQEARALCRVDRASAAELHTGIAAGSVDLLIVDGQPDPALTAALRDHWPGRLSPRAMLLWVNAGQADTAQSATDLGAAPGAVLHLPAGAGLTLAVIGTDTGEGAGPRDIVRAAAGGGAALRFITLLLRLGEGQAAVAQAAAGREQIMAARKSRDELAQARKQAAAAQRLEEGLAEVQLAYRSRHARASALAVQVEDWRRGAQALIAHLQDGTAPADPPVFPGLAALSDAIARQAAVLTAANAAAAAAKADAAAASEGLTAAKADAAAASEGLTAAKADAAAASEGLTAAKADAAAASGALAAAKAKAAAADADAREARDAAAGLTQRLAEAQHRLSVTQARLTASERRLAEVKASTSWRITAPLRALRRPTGARP